MSNTDQTIAVNNRAHDGYRRAGVAFAKGVNLFEAGYFNKDQLAMLEDDPRLQVGAAEETQVAAPAETEGAVADGGLDDPLAKGMEKLLVLVEEDKLELNSSGKPNADALGVNARQRDEIWEEYKAIKQAGLLPPEQLVKDAE